MDQEELGRLSVIYQLLDFWRTHDPTYRDKQGFLAYLQNCDFGCYEVKDTQKWLKLRKEARKSNSSVSEILFVHWQSMAGKKVSFSRDSDRPPPAQIDVVDGDKKKELEDITQRLKNADPARKKRLE